MRCPRFSEGSLEVKLPTIWTDGKAEVARIREEKRRRKKIREEKVREKKMQVRKKGRKFATHGVLTMICGSGWSKSRLAKAAGAEPSGQMRDVKLHAAVARSTFRCQKCEKMEVLGPLLEVEISKKCTPLLREAHFEAKSVKN